MSITSFVYYVKVKKGKNLVSLSHPFDVPMPEVGQELTLGALPGDPKGKFEVVGRDGAITVIVKPVGKKKKGFENG